MAHTEQPANTPDHCHSTVALPARSFHTDGLLSSEWQLLASCGLICAGWLSGLPALQLVLNASALVLAVEGIRSAGFTCTAHSMRLGALAFFGIAFLLSPYASITTISFSALSVGAFLLASGSLWVWAVGRPIRWPGTDPQGVGTGLLMAGFMAVFLWGAIFAPLMWRGDEDYLLARLLALSDMLTRTPFGGTLAVGGALAVLICMSPAGSIRPAVQYAGLGLLLALGTACFAQANAGGEMDFDLRRYPFFITWFQALLTLNLGQWPDQLMTESAMIRMLPFLSLVLLALILQTHLSHDRPGRRLHNRLETMLAAVAFTMVPALGYYACTGYVDIVLIVLMAWVGLTARDTVFGYLATGRSTPAWIALALIPLIKETAVIFVAGTVAVATLFALGQIRKRAVPIVTVLSRLARLCTVLMVPVLVFLVFRKQGAEVQYKYFFCPRNFAQLGLYPLQAKAIMVQFGWILPFAAVGLLAGWRQRRWEMLLVGTIALGYFLLFNGGPPRMRTPDDQSLPMFAGYARFNLYVLPAVLFLAMGGFVWLRRRIGFLRWPLTAALLVGQLLLSPVALDGSHPRSWGSPLRDVEGSRYPYDDLYAWLSPRTQDKPTAITVIGRRYSYELGDRMAARRHDRTFMVSERLLPFEKLLVGQPLTPASVLLDEFAAAAVAEPDFIVIHEPAWGPYWPDTPLLDEYALVRTFTLGTQRLIVYEAAGSV